MKKRVLSDLNSRKEFNNEKRNYLGSSIVDFSEDFAKLPSSAWSWSFIGAGGTFNLPSWETIGIELDCALALEIKGVCPILTAEYVKSCDEIVWVPSHYIKNYKLVPETIEELDAMFESWWYGSLKRA